MQFNYANKKSLIIFVVLLLRMGSLFAILGLDFSFLNFYKKKSEYETVKCNFEGISGTVPVKINQIIKQLNRLPLYQEISNNFRNRLILYGPPGNGKTTFARIIATETNSEFLEIHGPSTVETYVGSGPKKINDTFEYALKQTFDEGKKFVIFVDEIDSIAISGSAENMHQYRITLQTLWLWLDKIKKTSNIFVIVASNKYKELDATFLSRFGSNVIEITNPDEQLRREIINFNIKVINESFDPDFKLSDKTINYLVKKTDGFPIRSIEDIMASIQNESEKNIDNILKIHRQKIVNKSNLEEENRAALKWNKISVMLSSIHTFIALVDLTQRIYKLDMSNYLPISKKFYYSTNVMA